MFSRSRLSGLSKYLEITEMTETTETTGADLRKRQSSQTSQSSHALSHCHGKTSPTPVTLCHRLQGASRHESRTKWAKGIGAAKGDVDAENSGFGTSAPGRRLAFALVTSSRLSRLSRLS